VWAGEFILKGERMNTNKLMDVLSQLEEKINNHWMVSGSKKNRYLVKIGRVKQTYTHLEVPEPFEDLYSSLVKRGNDLLKELKRSKNAKELNQKVSYYLRYVQASTYDLMGNIKGINYYTRSFIVATVLFMALTPQFYGFILPVFFILPIFAGLKGIRKRNHSGFLMTLAVIPMALMTGITWIRYIFAVVLPDFSGAVSATAQMWNVPASTAQLLIIVPGILSVVLIAASAAASYFAYKYHDMFV
jgi:hypothetical protein